MIISESLSERRTEFSRNGTSSTVGLPVKLEL
jgi:hypothetical protein